MRNHRISSGTSNFKIVILNDLEYVVSLILVQDLLKNTEKKNCGLSGLELRSAN